MPAIRLPHLRLLLVLVLSLFLFHFLFSSHSPNSTEDDSWNEILGLDHYANFEAGVQDTVLGGIGVIKGGLGWGRKGRELGGLYDLILTSNPTPHPAYYDHRSSLDRLRLTSTRVLGHSAADLGSSSSDDESSPTEELLKPRRHILVTGGFGSIGKFVVRDLLIGLGGGRKKRDEYDSDGVGGEEEETEEEEDVFVTVLDVRDRSEELNFVFGVESVLSDESGERKGRKGRKGTDPRVLGSGGRFGGVGEGEKTVAAFKRSGKLRIVLGDVRDSGLIESLLGSESVTIDDERRFSQDKTSNHVSNTVSSITIPPISGIIHLGIYNPESCRLNKVDCEDVDFKGMKNLLEGIEKREKSKDRPWFVIPRKGDPWKETYNSSTPEPSSTVLLKHQTITHPLHSLLLQLPSTHSILGNPFSPRFHPLPHILHSALGHLPIQIYSPQPGEEEEDEPISLDEISLLIIQSARMLELSSKKKFLNELGFVSEIRVFGTEWKGRGKGWLKEFVEEVVGGSLSLSPVLVGEKKVRKIVVVEDIEEAVVLKEEEVETEEGVEEEGVEEEGVVEEGSLIVGEEESEELEEKVLEVEEVEEDDTKRIRRRWRGRRSLSSSGQEKANLRRITTNVLGFTPSIPMRTAIKSYLQSILSLQSEHLSKKLNIACSSPPPVPVLEEGLLALTGCNVQLLTVFEGSYYTLGCSAGLEDDHLSPLALISSIPFKEGVRGVEIIAERGMEGKVDLQIRCPTVVNGKSTGESEIVVWADTSDGGEFAEESLGGERTIAEWFTVDFIRRDARAFTITLPPTEGVAEGDEPKRSLVLRGDGGSTNAKKDLVFMQASTEARPLLWRINPICCANVERRKDLWDFFKEDPVITSQVTFPSEDGRTSLSDSTLAIQRCSDARREQDRITKIRKHLSTTTVNAPRCDPQRGEASAWELRESTTCQIDCLAPLPCIASLGCKCTRDRCGDSKKNGPFPEVAFTNKTSFLSSTTLVEKAKPLTIAERVSTITWESIILPGARRAFSTPLEDLPRANVVELPESIDTHLQSSACYDLDKSPLPFLGDHILIEALRNYSLPLGEADFAMVPYYQGCYYNYLQENTFKKLAESVAYAQTQFSEVDNISPSKVVIPFTHDFGSCTGWWPRLEDVLGRSPPAPMDQAVAWQVNGDTNTRCIKPDRDVVIPAISKHSKALFSTFGDLKSVKPVNQRKHLGFFAGGVRGFGAVARTRIGCGRTSQNSKTAKILYQQFASGERYLGTLNSAKFCLLPRGIPAWTTRTFEAIYAGCIPAFIVDRNIFPFQDILDYSLFSVTIPENEAHRVEDILARYSPAQLFELQAHLLKVREAFLFTEGKEWERRGPLFFSLVSMAMRLDLEYPAAGSCSTKQGSSL